MHRNWARMTKYPVPFGPIFTIYHNRLNLCKALFRVDFSGRGELADRQQKLALMLSRLQKLRLVLKPFLAHSDP